MAAMTIRKISEQAVNNMKHQAKVNGRSVEAEARMALEEKYASAVSTRSAWEIIEEFKRQNGGGFEIPVLPRNKEPIEPADFG